MIRVEGLHKTYNKTIKAVDGVSLQVGRGEFFSFLGPNGAGKSTVINILCGILSADGGRAEIDGRDIFTDKKAVTENVGVVFQTSVLDKKLTVKENLESRAALYGMNRSEIKTKLFELTERFGLEGILKRPLERLSGGQKRRVDIARAVLNSPKVLFLDEPTTGLDPQTRGLVWGIINSIRKQNDMTVFLTTHYMEESEFADKIAIIDEGRIAVSGTPAALKEEYSSDFVRLLPSDIEWVKRYLADEGFAYTDKGGALEMRIESSKAFIPHLAALEGVLDSFELLKGNMDSVFLGITGKALREE